ncbi:hypothetical protein DM02DRAFT_677377 [Periconia macrospinosa]|uniref:Alcohol dehydrogenase-like C-terminal domain-containing protein n=1 Tax=Periconia macrospinosa TaxID=97972 RepID=A0A2V1D561_9PLEO|nr:hypothetical protein DM02DRAFT_677377 [Periconia macrospinosa]
MTHATRRHLTVPKQGFHDHMINISIFIFNTIFNTIQYIEYCRQACSEGPFQQASQYIRSKGTIVCVGLPANAYLKAPVFDTVTRMITIKGSYVGNRQDTTEAIDFFARGLIKAPFKTVGLSELQDVFHLMEQGKIAGRYVVDTSR